MRRIGLFSIPIVLATLAFPTSSPAQASTPRLALKKIVSVDQAVALTTRHGDKAVWVAQKSGKVVRISGKTVQPKLDVSSTFLDDGERGLLGLAFSQDGAHLFIDGTRQPDGASIVLSFDVSPHGKVIASSQRQLLIQTQPYANHNGGNLLTGPDGDLYIGFGDGGSGGDPQHHAQDPSTWLGKILRIDPRLHPGGKPYGVPADNPFVGHKGYLPEIWIVGVRNPWRFEFDRSNGDLWIGDVGQDKYEEVDHLKAVRGRNAGRGANLGWSAFEGDHVYNSGIALTSHSTKPVYEYTHNPACAITGGFVYRGTRIPSLRGSYLFSDYCSGGLQTAHGLLLATDSIISFGQDRTGELWTIGADGTLSKIVAA
jgi:glucose/arabinose dehydrogenase